MNEMKNCAVINNRARRLLEQCGRFVRLPDGVMYKQTVPAKFDISRVAALWAASVAIATSCNATNNALCAIVCIS